MKQGNYLILTELTYFWAAYLSLNSQEKTLMWRSACEKFIKEYRWIK